MSAIFEHTKAFSGFSVDDVAAARRFYGETLGIALEEQDNGLLSLHIAGGRDTIVYPKSDHKPASFTILNFPVEDIDDAVDELAERGVSFERYDGMAQDREGHLAQPRRPADRVVQGSGGQYPRPARARLATGPGACAGPRRGPS